MGNSNRARGGVGGMRTPYSEENRRKTDRAHLCARRDVYPELFGVPADRICYPELPDAQERDFEKGIDYTIEIWVPALYGPVRVTVQERFRDPKFADRRDLSITYRNNNSDFPGEIHRLEAGLFVYGYHDLFHDQFIEVIGCWVPPLLTNIARGEIQAEEYPNPRSNQDVLYYKFDDLMRLPGVVAYHKDFRRYRVSQQFDRMRKSVAAYREQLDRIAQAKTFLALEVATEYVTNTVDLQHPETDVLRDAWRLQRRIISGEDV
jgi:hypothetical protein